MFLLKERERMQRKLLLSHSCSRHIGVADLLVGVRLPLDGSEEAEDSRRARRGWGEFIRRRLQSKEVIIFSRSVARSLIKVAAERNQQGPHQFYVSSFFLRASCSPFPSTCRALSPHRPFRFLSSLLSGARADLGRLIVQPNNRNF